MDDCIKTVAVANQNSVTVYGINGPNDITTYQANNNGYVDISDMANASGANFEFQQGVDATFATPQTAEGLYNAAAAYGQTYPDDAKLSLNDAGSEDGGPIPPHQTHDLGRSVDMRYIDSDGNDVSGHGEGNVLRADDPRMIDLVNYLKAGGFNQIYSDNDRTYGTQWAPGHGSHLHAGKNKETAQRERQKATPPNRPGPRRQQ
jgi:hypothetical protein